MRIDRLDLIAFGHFTNTSIDLSEGTCGLHLIYGDNEAGKSTSLRALIALLFGIPPHTADNYLHANQHLRIGGKVGCSDGRKLEFVRRKGIKNTLLHQQTDIPLDDSVLLPFIPDGMDEHLFTKLYGINHARLVAGGQELLNQAGDLGQALFSAAIGTANLRATVSQLRNDADELYKPRATTKAVNMAIAGFREAQKRIKESMLPVAEWKRLQDERAETVAAIDRVEMEISAVSNDKSRLDRINRVKGALAEYHAVTTHIAELGAVTLLPEDFRDTCRSVAEKMRIAHEANIRNEAKLSSLTKESAIFDPCDDILGFGETILSLYRRLGALETMMADRPQLEENRRLLHAGAKELLKGVLPGVGLEDAERLRPLINNKEWLADLTKEYAVLHQKKDTAANELRTAEDNLETIGKELAPLNRPVLDVNKLKATVAASRKAGDLENRMTAMQGLLQEARTSYELELLRIGRFSGTSDELLTLALPVPETLDTFEKQFDDLTERIRDCQRKEQDLEQEHRQAKQELETLLLTNDVATIPELDQARSQRNTGWHLIRKKYIEGSDVDNEIAAFSPDIPLPLMYEQKVNRADHVADRLRLAAGEVARRATLETRIRNIEKQHAGIAEELSSVNTDLASCQEVWDTLWKPFGVEPGTPREMKQWMLRVEKCISNIQAADRIDRDTLALAADCDSIRKSLSLSIVEFDETADLENMSLEAMISLCEQHITLTEAVRERKRLLEHSSGETALFIRRIREKLVAIDREQSAWQRNWEMAIDGLGLNPDVHPEQAAVAFNRLVAFFDTIDRAEELRRRSSGMDLAIDAFEKEVFAVADRIAVNREAEDACTVAARLHRDLNEAREQRARSERIELRKKELIDEIEDNTLALLAARTQLAALMAQAGVASDDDLEPAAEKSQTMRRLRLKLDTLEDELVRNGDGRDIHELVQEAGTMDIDAIDSQRESVSARLRDLQAERDALRDRRQTVQNEINARDGSAAAANASEEAAQQLAAIISGAERYLRLQTATLILERKIEEYRMRNQAPVLSRAGTLFSRLTLQSYAHLRDELNENGKPILLGVRSNGSEVGIDAMSDGTRDQLYLSLRLATLEQHLSRGEPMPFIVDDILSGFDDQRTAACLNILAELSNKTQVLLFTHHRRVLDLARAIEAASGIICHELA